MRCEWELGRFVGRESRFFVAASVAGLALRLALVIWFPAVVDDSRLYADIAKNWLQQGVYGITNSGVITPTLSRLPGYPAFLATVFAIFGADNFRAVLLIQVLFDLATCLLVAEMARRLFSERAAKAAFLLTALCPFLANYAGAALTETLEIFFTALALYFAIAALGIDGAPARPFVAWFGCGLAVGAAILLRPDGGILLAAIGGFLLWLLVRSLRQGQESGDAPEPALSLPKGLTEVARPGNVKSSAQFSPRTIIIAGVIVACAALAPLIPWTLRNLHTLHHFEPLAPRYATDSDEMVMPGFNRWVKTWIADYDSVQEIYWPVPGSEMDFTRLPNRAFDSIDQRKQTEQLFSEYNESHSMSPELDARFGELAAERIHHAPLRYYLWLPTLRIADMWLRPRTELFPSDPRWWEFNDDPRWLTVSLAFGAINLGYVLLALGGLVRGRQELFGIGLFILFLLLRSAFLGTLENPEPRYTLECYPVMLVLASAWLARET